MDNFSKIMELWDFTNPISFCCCLMLSDLTFTVPFFLTSFNRLIDFNYCPTFMLVSSLWISKIDIEAFVLERLYIHENNYLSRKCFSDVNRSKVKFEGFSQKNFKVISITFKELVFTNFVLKYTFWDHGWFLPVQVTKSVAYEILSTVNLIMS